jgi:hypothetical protein
MSTYIASGPLRSALLLEALLMCKSKHETIEDEEAIPVGVETAAETALTTNIYGEIRKRLAVRGVPVEQVAFIHDAKMSVTVVKGLFPNLCESNRCWQGYTCT